MTCSNIKGGVWRSALVGSLGIDVLIDYVLMFKHSSGEGK